MQTRIIRGFICFLCVVFAGGTGNAIAQMKTGSEKQMQNKEFQISEAQKGGRLNAFMVERIIGSKVQSMQGEDLGTIKDIVIDIDSGRILYAVLDFGGFLGLVGGKLYPVPWNVLLPLPSEGVFFLEFSKEKLKNAPGYDKNNLPDMGDMHWGKKIAGFYEAPREERSYTYDYDYGYEYGYGFGFYPSIAQQDPLESMFNPKSVKRLTGEVIKVDRVIPKKGNISQMQVKLIVFANNKEAVPVYLGPVWYIIGPNRRIPFKSGDRITVTGSWITSRTEPFMIATTVTKGDRTLTLRHKDGSPAWNAWKKIGMPQKAQGGQK